MTELHPNTFDTVRSLFTGPHLDLVIGAVIARTTPGRIWADSASSPRSVLLWDTGRRYYLGGREDNNEFNLLLRCVIAEEKRSADLAQRLSILVYYASDDWGTRLDMLFADRKLRKRRRSLYRLRRVNVPDWRVRLGPGLSVAPINRELLYRSDLGNLGAAVEEIRSMWTSMDQFLSSGFGFCMLDGGEMVCWCTAEYVSENKCGVGVQTVEPRRGEGLATLTASAFAEHSLTHRIVAHWDSWSNNTPSLRVAEKVGFEKVLDYEVYEG